MALAAIGLGLGLLGAGLKYGSDLDSARTAARLQREQVQEQIRRFTLDFERTRSEAEALGMASGITADSGSLRKYLLDMTSEFERQRDMLRKAGDFDTAPYEQAALFDFMGGIGSSLFQYGAANNWFRKPTVG